MKKITKTTMKKAKSKMGFPAGAIRCRHPKRGGRWGLCNSVVLSNWRCRAKGHPNSKPRPRKAKGKKLKPRKAGGKK